VKYLACCVDSTAELIDALLDAAEEVSFTEALEHCEGLLAWAEAKGYSEDDFPLKGDWHVNYLRSTYDGQPCYVVQWSGIEYIWTADGTTQGWGYGDASL